MAQATTSRDLSTRTLMIRRIRGIEEVALLIIREASSQRAIITKETHARDTAARGMRRRRPVTGSFMTLLFPIPNTLRIKKK